MNTHCIHGHIDGAMHVPCYQCKADHWEAEAHKKDAENAALRARLVAAMEFAVELFQWPDGSYLRCRFCGCKSVRSHEENCKARLFARAMGKENTFKEANVLDDASGLHKEK